MKDEMGEEVEEVQAPKWAQPTVPGRHIDGGIQGVRLWDEPEPLVVTAPRRRRIAR